jgi:acetyltransferase
LEREGYLLSEKASRLKAIFDPNSIAIIGASKNPQKLGNRILQNLLDIGFKGRIHCVNPNVKEILGYKCYGNIKEVPETVDLAVLVVPALSVLEAMQDCVERGLKAAIIITSGFAETGQEGRKLQNDLVDIIQKGGMSVVGPNCEGIFNANDNVNLTFAPKHPPKGGISFISQSGALGANTMFRWAAERQVGFSKFSSSGNEADLSSADYLEYLSQDPATKVAMIYLEGVKDGRKFFEALRKTCQVKPVVIMKGGETTIGARAVESHTGVLAGSDAVFSAACKQAGAVRVYDADELFDVAMTFAGQPIPKGKNVGLVTGAGGGMGVIAADACAKLGLTAPPYSEGTMAKLRNILPSYAPVNNPVDLTPIFDPMRLVKCTEIALQDEKVDSVISMGFGWRSDLVSIEAEAVEEFVKLRAYGKPVLVVSPSSKWEFESLRQLEAMGYPVFLTPKKAALALAALVANGENFLRKGV